MSTLRLVKSDTEASGGFAPESSSGKMGGGNGGGGMEARLDRLEKEMHGVQEMLGKLIVEVAELRGKLSGLPTTIQLASFTLASVLATAGLVFTIVKLSVVH